jgi:hypothetical protein
MKLVGKVPVEPLDDERLTNIERRLVVHVSEMSQRPLRAAPRRMLAFAAVALAVVVAGFVGWRVRGDGTPVVAPARPDFVAMKSGALDLGDVQITGNDFTVMRSPGRTDIEMQPGRIDLVVEHEPGRLLVVKAGNVEIEDIGTRFSVDYDGKRVDVRVTEGEVKVKHAGKEFPIVAGNAWTIEEGPVTIAQLDAKQAAALVAQAQVQAPDPVDVVGAAGGGSGSSARAGSNGEQSGRAHGSSSRPRKAGGPDAKKSFEKWPDEPLVPTEEKDPKKAATLYLNEAQNLDGEQKANYLQSIAVMHLRAKNYESAVSVLRGVLHERRASEWPAHKSALWLDVRAKCLLSRSKGPTFDEACRLAGATFFDKYPNEARAGAVQQMFREI